ncbi:single-stranded DNA-binding protein [Mesomycoplasma conjunctivae]|uniref:Single-stranded DNA-binding protein n=1 Tax=Mesomycoplasma conjunctivae (strain ATCC 25834 / NCTC 10147 / HRC/581) TaxID=572263 RepID=C5J6F1_MESCH|nr:single-stranded DNA-binding protein [Mesomycoplasma conjunctivae]CAT05043.1 Single-stranded DNA-binding protein [Mesomycoplasma conjunctivae]VEU66299.1 single-stranded DNA-binding protein [Mesomycoplasma conjunctivae]
MSILGLNNVILIGRLTSNIKVNYTKNDISYARFTLAISRKYNSQTDHLITDFIPIIVWRQNAINLEKLVCKGSPLLVKGSLQSNKYTNDDGKLVNNFEVLLEGFEILESKEEFQKRQQQVNTQTSSSDKDYAIPFEPEESNLSEPDSSFNWEWNLDEIK